MSAGAGPRLSCPLRSAALRWPEAAAVVGVPGTVTFREWDAQVSRVAARLSALGLRAGDVVALTLFSDYPSLVLLLATLRAELIACPLHLRNPVALQIAQAVRVGAVAAVVAGATDGWREAGLRVIPMEELLQEGRAPHAPSASGAADDIALAAQAPATLVYTSGSTAVPKVAALSLANHLANAAASNRQHGLLATDRWLLSLPLYHVGGLAIVFRCLLAGAAVVIADARDDLAAATQRWGATQLSLVPTQLARLLNQGTRADGMQTLRNLLLGGAPAADAVVAAALARGWPVRKTYGLTEMASQVTSVPPVCADAQRYTGGRVLTGCEVRIAQDGEIHVRGPMLFLGYWEDGKPRPCLTTDGWFATGDVGELDAAGWIRVRGRRDNLIISGGENVQPEEVELALAGLPGIALAVVVPVPDVEFGQRLVAFVRMHGDADIQSEALARQLAGLLPRFKMPVAFYPLPVDADARGGKVQRAALIKAARALQASNEAPA